MRSIRNVISQLYLTRRRGGHVTDLRGGVMGVIPIKQTYQRANGTPFPLDEELKWRRADDNAKNKSKLGNSADTCLKTYRLVAVGVA